jgi:hypothetical protein
MDLILDAVNSALGEILSFLPDSPFQYFLSQMEKMEFLKTLNWLVPISSFISIGMTWLSAVSVYYIYQIILRWARAIE